MPGLGNGRPRSWGPDPAFSGQPPVAFTIPPAYLHWDAAWSADQALTAFYDRLKRLGAPPPLLACSMTGMMYMSFECARDTVGIEWESMGAVKGMALSLGRAYKFDVTVSSQIGRSGEAFRIPVTPSMRPWANGMPPSNTLFALLTSAGLPDLEVAANQNLTLHQVLRGLRSTPWLDWCVDYDEYGKAVKWPGIPTLLYLASRGFASPICGLNMCLSVWTFAAYMIWGFLPNHQRSVADTLRCVRCHAGLA